MEQCDAKLRWRPVGQPSKFVGSGSWVQEAVHFEAVRATVRNGSVVCAMLLGQMLP